MGICVVRNEFVGFVWMRRFESRIVRKCILFTLFIKTKNYILDEILIWQSYIIVCVFIHLLVRSDILYLGISLYFKKPVF